MRGSGGGLLPCLAKLREHARGRNATPTCPLCRCPLPADLQRNLIAEQAIALLPAACRHDRGEGTTRGSLAAHASLLPVLGFLSTLSDRFLGDRFLSTGGALTGGELLAVVFVALVLVCHPCTWPCARVLEIFFVACLLGAANKNAALLLASDVGLAHVVVLLITAGADVDSARAVDGVTALFFAAQSGHVGVVARLIDAGADINKARTDCGATPVYIAAELGHVDVVRRLIAAPGVDVNKACTSGFTPLSTALALGHADVAQKLRAAGAIDPRR